MLTYNLIVTSEGYPMLVWATDGESITTRYNQKLERTEAIIMCRIFKRYAELAIERQDAIGAFKIVPYCIPYSYVQEGIPDLQALRQDLHDGKISLVDKFIYK